MSLKIENFFNNLWYKKNFVNQALLIFLSPLLLTLSLIVKFITCKKSKLINKDPNQSPPLIIIGNLNVGGSGKTPSLIYLAKALHKETHKVVIIVKGYKGELIKQNKAFKLTSNMDAKQTGDEAKEIYDAVLNLGISVFIAKNRNLAYNKAAQQKPDFILSDDGLQSINLLRSFEIVAIDEAKGFGCGLSRGQSIPFGPLRSSLAFLNQVDVALITNSNNKSQSLNKEIARYNSQLPIFYQEITQLTLIDLTDKNNKKISPTFLKGKKILALDSIAHPDKFHTSLKNFLSLDSNKFSTLSLGDHRCYTDEVFKIIEQTCQDKDTKIIITTSKDAVKFTDSFLEIIGKKSIQIFVVQMEVEIKDLHLLLCLIKTKLKK